MPIIKSDYIPRIPLFRNAHFSTIFPTQFRSIRLRNPLIRERLTTSDQDFIDLDISDKKHRRAAILMHGFEGSSRRPYIRGMARLLQNQNWDIVAMNHRGCSGEPNRTARAYHAGEYGDVTSVIKYILETRDYQEIALVGFSLGGNILLNYLAKQSEIPTEVIGGVAVSVPIDLRTAVFEIMKPGNWIYHRDFYTKVMQKMRLKERMYPDLLPYQDIFRSRNIDEIDENYTAPFHGFKDATHYREKSSALFILDQIKRPALLINACNDPFLTESSYPYEVAKSSAELSLITPRYGGHCGFWMRGGVYYHEGKAGSFLGHNSNL